MKKAVLSLLFLSPACYASAQYGTTVVFSSMQDVKSFDFGYDNSNHFRITFGEDSVAIWRNDQPALSSDYERFQQIYFAGLSTDLQTAEDNNGDLPSIFLYQNNGFLSLQGSTAFSMCNARISLSTLTGLFVESREVVFSSESEVQIPLTHLPQGIYLLTLTGNFPGSSASLKFHVQP